MRADFGRVTAVFISVFFRQPREERQDVFATFTQWWNGNTQSGEPVKQIWPQSVLHGSPLLLKITNCYDPCLCGCALLIDNTQQTGLCRITKGLNILKHQRATARFFKGANTAVLGGIKKALHQRIFINTAAADQHKLFRRARTNRMKRVGHKRFTSTRFTVDQHMTVRLAQIQNIFFQPRHYRRCTDQLFHQRATVRQLATQCAIIKR